MMIVSQTQAALPARAVWLGEKLCQGSARAVQCSKVILSQDVIHLLPECTDVPEDLCTL